MGARPRRRLLGVLAALTLALTLLDVAGSGVPDSIRAASRWALGPAQRALSGGSADALADLRAENTRLRTAMRQQQRALDEVADLRRLLASEAVGGRAVVAARVVASEASLTGGRAVTLDVGARDGVFADSTVVAAEGLVGRVVAVGPWTSEVQVLGAAGSSVGVRVGAAGTLGAVGPRSAARYAARPPGTLSLDLVQPGSPVIGDEVMTLGSVGDRPYVPGVPVGTVIAVDPERGHPTRSATVRPSVDLDALDVVAVVVSAPRAGAREEASR